MPPLKKREENIRLLKLAAEGKLTAEDIIKKQPGFRIWLNLTGKPFCVDEGPGDMTPPPANPDYKITLDLSK